MSTASVLDPVHTALLVMDYQPAILAALPEGGTRNALLGRAEGAIADVRAHGGTIAYVRVGFTDADWDVIPAINKSFAPLAQHRVMHHADPATAIHERLAPQDGDGGVHRHGLRDPRLQVRAVRSHPADTEHRRILLDEPSGVSACFQASEQR
ncbi:hypothetical protein ACWEKM_35165 [Streptomyces sp. NPDC004752]